MYTRKVLIYLAAAIVAVLTGLGIGHYTHRTDSSSPAQTGALDELHALAKPFGIGFSYDPGDQTGNYTVKHSAVMLLVNPQVQEAAIFTPPIIPRHMADNYRNLVAGYGNRS